MYRRIVVPLDGSKLAEQVLPYVRLLAGAMKARVTLLRVFEPVPPEMVEPSVGRYMDRLVASFRNEAGCYLEKIESSLKDVGVPVSLSVHEGDAATYILWEAEREPGTLIAMTTHGRSGVTRWLLGSVTDKVLRASVQPLLVVRVRDHETPLPEAKIETIIVPLDGSALAEQTLPHVTSLAKALDVGVTLVRAVPPAASYYSYSISPPFALYEEMERGLCAEALAYLGQVKQRMSDAGVRRLEVRLLHGEAEGAILDTACHMSDCLIGMTTHGRSGLGRWVLGSVTDRVVRNAHAPVLVIRAAKDGGTGEA